MNLVTGHWQASSKRCEQCYLSDVLFDLSPGKTGFDPACLKWLSISNTRIICPRQLQVVKSCPVRLGFYCPAYDDVRDYDSKECTKIVHTGGQGVGASWSYQFLEEDSALRASGSRIVIVIALFATIFAQLWYT